MGTIVVKIGSRLLATEDGRIETENIARLIDGIVALRATGNRVVLVSSGAVAAGVGALQLAGYPDSLVVRQATASIGQARLMHVYQDLLQPYGLHVAQVLITRGELHHRGRFLNARNTLAELLQRNVIPIINENDAVAVDELIVGDNDQLAAITSFMAEADLCVLLTDVNGILRDTSDPASLVEEVHTLEDMAPLIQPKESKMSTGGMQTKLLAAQMNSDFGIDTLIGNGHREGLLELLAENWQKPLGLGTWVHASKEPVSAWKYWLRHGARPEGAIHVDAGACRALVQQQRSLLPSGVREIEGDFDYGAMVAIVHDGAPIAWGIVQYKAADCRRIAGHASQEILPILGYRRRDEMINRNDMVFEKPET